MIKEYIARTETSHLNVTGLTFFGSIRICANRVHIVAGSGSGPKVTGFLGGLKWTGMDDEIILF